MSGPKELSDAPSQPDVIPVSTDLADYRIVTKWHGDEALPREIGIDTKYLCIETGFHSHALQDLPGQFAERLNRPHYRNITSQQQLEEIYITDTIGDPSFELLMDNEVLDGLIMTILAGVTAAASATSLIVSRRGVVKGAGIALAGIAAYCALPYAAFRSAKSGAVAPPLESTYNNRFRYIGLFRNLVIAHKAEYLANRIKDKTGTRPTLAMIMGPAHGPVAAALKKTTSQEREVLMQQFLTELESKLPKQSVDRVRASLYEIPILNSKTKEVGIINIRIQQEQYIPAR